VADCCGAAVALGVGLGVSVAGIDAVALGEEDVVALGDGGGEGDGDRERDGNREREVDALGGEGVGFSFFFVAGFLRCLAGVGVGLTKIFFTLSRNDSSCSCAPRTWLATAIKPIIAIAINERSFIFTGCFP
jgi:hypothetical protein